VPEVESTMELAFEPEQPIKMRHARSEMRHDMTV
jgi:hypothetical protein